MKAILRIVEQKQTSKKERRKKGRGGERKRKEGEEKEVGDVATDAEDNWGSSSLNPLILDIRIHQIWKDYWAVDSIYCIFPNKTRKSQKRVEQCILSVEIQ